MYLNGDDNNHASSFKIICNYELGWEAGGTSKIFAVFQMEPITYVLYTNKSMGNKIINQRTNQRRITLIKYTYKNACEHMIMIDPGAVDLK